jgi:hypothetical protein
MTSVFGNRKTQYAKPDDASTSREERMTRLKFEVSWRISYHINGVIVYIIILLLCCHVVCHSYVSTFDS